MGCRAMVRREGNKAKNIEIERAGIIKMSEERTKKTERNSLDYPIPKIRVSPSKISLGAYATYEGDFIIENMGAGMLEGRIFSDSDALILPFEEFSGNRVVVHYIINLDGYKIGDYLNWRVIIFSNGGEKVVDFKIEVTAPAIITKDGATISSMEQFLDYVKEQPIAARQLFTQQDFMLWLFNSGFRNMDLYDAFAADPNKERAVDNFLILNG
ncbi:MAG: DUF5717 family protein [Defluviitaleaceae bacterium]|nr:DUF5717 family protein [Defluviitaleaceae bacterium]